jgi:type IV secretory pathway TrbD component
VTEQKNLATNGEQGYLMEIEIQESRTNKWFRIISKGVCIYFITFGILVVIMELILKQWYLAALGVLVSAIGFYNKKRLARITAIRDNSLVLLVEKSKIELNKEEVSSITKWVQVTITQRFPMTISLKERKFGIVKSYIVTNEPAYDFLHLFSRMGIRLKNVPKEPETPGERS